MNSLREINIPYNSVNKKYVEFSVTDNKPFDVTLPGNADSGYKWVLVNDYSSFENVKKYKSPFYETINNDPNSCKIPGKWHFQFTPINKGTEELEFKYIKDNDEEDFLYNLKCIIVIN
jgi:predicted secreted protein